MSEILELNEFFVEGRKQEHSHVLLHITEPSNAEERKKGYFFALAEINNGPLEQIEHLQQMIDDLESGYYETQDIEGKDAFETTLEYINRRGHHILQYKNSVVNCLVGVMRKNEVSFAYHGAVNIILFYKDKSNEFQEVNVLGDQIDGNSNNHLFSAIVQGNVNEGDNFYISTPHVTDYFGNDKTKKIISTRTPKQSTEHIQKVLSDLNSDISFGGILMHYPSSYFPKHSTPINQHSAGSDASINKLIAHEETTKEILSPPFLGGLKKKLRENKIKKTNQQSQILRKKKGDIETNFRKRQEKNKESLTNTILITIGKALVLGTIGLAKFIKNTTIKIGRSTVMFILLITNKDNKRKDVVKNIKTSIIDKKENISKLPILSKVLFISSIILATIFIISVTTYKIKENQAVTKQAYDNQIQAIVDKKNAADASIIYGDDQRATTLLQEAKDIVTKLPQDKKEDEYKVSQLYNEIDDVLMKLRKITTIDHKILINLKELNPEADTTYLAKIDSTLVAYGEKDTSLYKINLIDNSHETKDRSNITNLLLGSTPKEQDMIVFINGDAGISQYNKESSLLSTKEIVFPFDNVKLSDIFVYNRKLYTLDTNNNQIYRHSQTQVGYDKGTTWIKDSTSIDIKDAVSLAIDGDLFVLKKNGEIIKLTGGQKQDFTITGLDPILDNPTQIWTYNGIENIYVLESTNKRVIILNKEGKMLNQYTDDAWQNPTSMIVDEEEKTIYVLDDNKIYEFNY